MEYIVTGGVGNKVIANYFWPDVESNYITYDHNGITWSRDTTLQLDIDNASINATLIDDIYKQWTAIYGAVSESQDDNFECTDEVNEFLDELTKDVIED